MNLADIPEPTDADLFALLEEAKAESAPRPRKTARDLETEFTAHFQDSRNYRSAGHVSLVEETTRTFLGTFEAFVHSKHPDIRHLVRVMLPCTATIEYVKGEHWLSPLAKERARGNWKKEERITRVLVPAELTSSLSCDECELLTMENDVGLYRIELAAPAVFRSPEGRTILALPAGLDLLDELTREAKIKIRQAIDAQKE